MVKKKKDNNISVIHLSNYITPSVYEDITKKYVMFGEDNLYPNYLLELYNGSSINNAVIKGVSAMIYGEGIDATDKQDNDTKTEMYLRLMALINRGGDNVLKNLAFDLKLFGMCYVNLIWNKPRTKIVDWSHMPSQYMRSGKQDSFGNITEYYYSADWSEIRKKENRPRTFKAFSSEDRTEASTVLCIKDYSPGNHYYSLPDYIGSTQYIQLDLEISKFHLSNITSGMFPSMAINFANGVPTQEERKMIERQVNAKFSGSGNAGKILITFNDGKDTSPEIVPINANDNSDSYQFLSTETTRKVLTGHRVTSPLLFGVKGDGSGFGNNADELRDSYSLFNNTVIKPLQNTLLDGLKPLFSVNNIVLDLYFKTLKPADFINIDNIQNIDEDEQEKEGVTNDEELPINEVEEIKETPENSTEEVKDAVMEEPLEKEASYNGAQISSAIDIIAKVQEGVLTKEQATVFLIQFLQLPPEVAKGFFLEGESAVEKLTESINLKKKKVGNKTNSSIVVNDDNEKVCLDYFDEVGINLNEEEWFEAHTEQVSSSDSMSKYHEFAYAPAGYPNRKTKGSDIGMFRLLYRYSTNLSSKSRLFCQKMVAKSQNGTLYTLEDLERASNRAVNKGFGPYGSNTYDIFLYKGGPNCKHYWERVWYFRRQVPKGMVFVDIDGKEYKGGEFLPNGTLNNFIKASQSQASSAGAFPKRDDSKARREPYRMPNHGYLKPR